MAKNTDKLAAGLAQSSWRKMPHTGGGAFGAARLGHIVATIQARLEPGQGLRPGRPTDASWVRHPKVPMSDATRQRLALLAEQSSTGGRKVSPMQIAAQILEDARAVFPYSERLSGEPSRITSLYVLTGCGKRRRLFLYRADRTRGAE